MAYIIEKSECFKNHPYAKYATTYRFEEVNRLSDLTISEAKEYFSKKRKGMVKEVKFLYCELCYTSFCLDANRRARLMLQSVAIIHNSIRTV